MLSALKKHLWNAVKICFYLRVYTQYIVFIISCRVILVDPWYAVMYCKVLLAGESVVLIKIILESTVKYAGISTGLLRRYTRISQIIVSKSDCK